MKEIFISPEADRKKNIRVLSEVEVYYRGQTTYMYTSCTRKNATQLSLVDLLSRLVLHKALERLLGWI